MITRSSGQHVFIALGTPWIDAVVAFLEPRARVDPWIMHGKMAIGDLLITVLDTTPRTLLCIETVAAPFDGTSPMEVDERPYELHGLPTVPELEQRWSITFPTDPGPVDDALADQILTAGQSHYAHYFGDIDTLDPTSTAAHARTLMNERGNCTGCGSPMPLRKFNSSDRLHFHSASRIFRQAEPGDDYPAVLCRKCTGRMATSGHTNFIDYMLAKNPPCPHCGAHRTAQCAPGMPVHPFDHLPWLAVTGCVVGPDTPEWTCRAC
eukprot:gene20605-24745_t